MQEFLHVPKILLMQPLSCCRAREQREVKIWRLLLEIYHYNTTSIYIICKYIKIFMFKKYYLLFLYLIL